MWNDKSVETAFYLIRSDRVKSDHTSSHKSAESSLYEELCNGASVMTRRLALGMAERMWRGGGRFWMWRLPETPLLPSLWCSTLPLPEVSKIHAIGEDAGWRGTEREVWEIVCHKGLLKCKQSTVHRICSSIRTYFTWQGKCRVSAGEWIWLYHHSDTRRLVGIPSYQS